MEKDLLTINPSKPVRGLLRTLFQWIDLAREAMQQVAPRYMPLDF
jgi:hypothetical protein